MFAFGGVVTYKNAKEVKSVVEKLDLKYILLETDAPYFTPTPYRGTRNEPAHIKYVAEEIANIKGLPIEVVEDETFMNACNILDVSREN